MAFNPLPQSWFNGLTDGSTTCLITDMVIPISTFPEMTAPEIDSVTGDIRKMIFAIMEKCWVKWTSIAIADRPNKMTFSKNVYTDTNTGLSTQTYTVTLITAVTVGAQDVAPEV